MTTLSNHTVCACSASAQATRARSRGKLQVRATTGAISSGAGRVPQLPGKNVCGVFQLKGSPVQLGLNDVRDAYEACSTARTVRERRQCFEVYGLDADKVDRYYERVCQMERLIDQGDSVAQGMVGGGGALMMYVVAYCILKV